MNFSAGQIAVISKHLEDQRGNLDQLRACAKAWGRHEDWPWNGFILSHATIGGSDNWSRIEEIYEDHFSWKSLNELDDSERQERFKNLGNPRYRARVAHWAAANFKKIEDHGGPKKARLAYEALQSANDRIKWVMSFSGFGLKYGRNIPMDGCDELVCNHCALDHRLRKILSIMGYPEVNYKCSEEMLIGLANQLGIDAWTLDRLIYGQFQQIKADLLSL